MARLRSGSIGANWALAKSPGFERVVSVYGFLLSRRWLGLGIFVVFMVTACWFLGNWQYDRWEARKASNALAVEHMAEAPIPLNELVQPGGTIPDDAEWTNVRATGSFRLNTDVVVRYIKNNDRPGVEVVTPFDLDSGGTILVNRGWMQTANTAARPDDIPPAVTGTVTIEGWWRPDNPAGAEASTPADGSVRAIDSTHWTSVLDSEATPGFIALQSPGHEGLTPQAAPGLGEGPHLFYAIQWFFFALLALFGGFWFVRDEVKQRRAQVTGATDDQASVTKSR